MYIATPDHAATAICSNLEIQQIATEFLHALSTKNPEDVLKYLASTVDFKFFGTKEAWSDKKKIQAELETFFLSVQTIHYNIRRIPYDENMRFASVHVYGAIYYKSHRAEKFEGVISLRFTSDNQVDRVFMVKEF